jgi:spore coat protein U-like protein
MMSVPKNVTTTLSIYGEIPPGQDVAAGLYTDNIVVTVYF